MEKFKFVICGFGQIGQMLFREIQKSDDMEVVAIIDKQRELHGVSVQEYLKDDTLPPLVIKEDIFALTDEEPDLCLVTTRSSAREVAPLVLDIIKKHIPVLTSCEEFFYLQDLRPELFKTLQDAAVENNCAILGAGINPGFLMDYLPLILSGISRDIKHIKVERVQDASQRRMQFQRKIGAGLNEKEFAVKKADGSLRHVGLSESMSFLAAALGWQLDQLQDNIQMVHADTDFNIPNAIPITKGNARGVHQIGLGSFHGKELIRLDFKAAIGEPDSYDRITIDGTPKIESTISGGVNGDLGTCAILLNAAKALLRSRRIGMLNMMDLPPIPGSIRPLAE